MWLAEGHLARGEATSARPLIERVIETTRATGYIHIEGLAHRVMSECLADEQHLAAEEHVKKALQILERCCAQNDFAKALATRATLRRRAGDFATARELIQTAKEIFLTLSTPGELARADEALAHLDRRS